MRTQKSFIFLFFFYFSFFLFSFFFCFFLFLSWLEMPKQYIFNNFPTTSMGDGDDNVIRILQAQSSSVKEASNFQKNLLHELISQNTECFVAHKNCLSTYTLKTHIEWHLKWGISIQSGISTTCKHSRRSHKLQFDWLKQCFFCGKECDADFARKNPHHLRESFGCQTLDRGTRN